MVRKDVELSIIMANLIVVVIIDSVLGVVRGRGGALSQMGSTALLLASNEGHVEVVRLLLESGADINFASVRGSSSVPVLSTAPQVYS